MNIRITDAARWQLRLTIQDLGRRQDPEAAQLAKRVREILSSPMLLKDSMRTLEGMPELPHREVELGSYRLLFHQVDDTLWLSGLWPPMYA